MPKKAPIPPAPSGPDDEPVEAPDDPVATLEAQVADYKDRFLRARADYDNLQRRIAQDAAIERDRVRARVLESFLQVYEFGQMAAWEAERNPGPLAEGVRMLVREFDRLLEREGVTRIGEVGEPFDPSLHEAVGEEDGGEAKPGHVSRVVAPGYRLGERVLRYAKVAVAPAADDVMPS
jgi:molecular chaperone GrpE